MSFRSMLALSSNSDDRTRAVIGKVDGESMADIHDALLVLFSIA
ncbi:hypothetical protein [Skermanella rosea]|nr:hypothetical protein [Skermanella rosea]